MSKSTHSATADEAQAARKWWIVDATDLTVGRMASRIASVLKGKHKPMYTPSLDTGDFVVVVNAEKVALTGVKETAKLYRYHTGFPGGLKTTSADKLRATRPEKIIEEAVRGMLPKTKLGKKMFKKLKVYAGPSHPHVAQTAKPA